MNAFKIAGVKTIFMEHLFYDTMQADIDSFIFSEKPMSKRLNFYLDGLEKKFSISHSKWGFKAILYAAKAAKIRVVAMDTEASYMSGVCFNHTINELDRCLGMNYQAYEIIQKEKDEGKFIVFTGGAHLSQMANVPGLSEILNSPNILISDQTTSSIKSDVSTIPGEKNFKGIIHIHLTLPKIH